MDNADLIAALDLVVNTGHATTDEHGNPHWAISERQRDIARDALVAARAPYSAPAKGTAAIRWLPGPGWAIIDATCSADSGCSSSISWCPRPNDQSFCP